MNYRLTKYSKRLNHSVSLESSKSESNRALLIHALANGKPQLDQLSNARDTQTMIRLLAEQGQEWDVLDAGTTMRFLSAYLGIRGKGETITGTDRMKNRPIGPLVDSMRKIGASISYLEKEGYPPLEISGVEHQKTSSIEIPGNISSQYISALLMIAPCLEKGLEIELTTEIFSRPYIQMTLDLMQHFGVHHQWEGQTIQIAAQPYQAAQYRIEGDWSGASYWYAMVALAPENSSIQLSYLKENSFQGDAVIAEIMQSLGVSSTFEDGKVVLRNDRKVANSIHWDFKDCPDLAQTVLVVAATLGCTMTMTGLESLRIKETDRILAMQNELAKIGAQLNEEGNTWTLIPTAKLPKTATIHTYEDHRMAMAFAPLYQVMELEIEDIEVVNKSYPSYWKHLESVGMEFTEQ